MKFYYIDKYILIGGGNLLRQLILMLKEMGADAALFVVTSKRHAEEKIDSQTFQEFLKENKIKYHISENINTDEEVFAEITPFSLCLSVGAAWIIKRSLIDRFGGKII